MNIGNQQFLRKPNRTRKGITGIVHGSPKHSIWGRLCPLSPGFQPGPKAAEVLDRTWNPELSSSISPLGGGNDCWR